MGVEDTRIKRSNQSFISKCRFHLVCANSIVGPGDPFDIRIGVRGILRLRLPSSDRSPGRLLWEFFSHEAATTASRR
jgi:hypothetical protein